jgi:hypothetical protein
MAYDGSQLRSLFNYLEHDLQGDSILAFVGPCSVALTEMVDGEDQKAKAEIASDKMLHFLIEVFHQNLFSAVCLQRLMADLAISTLKKLSSKEAVRDLRREGDDIFLAEKKLSISIATVSPLSQLIHFALNVTTKGTPVPTLSLEDLDVDPKIFGEQLGEAFRREFEDIAGATTKVHWVR